MKPSTTWEQRHVEQSRDRELGVITDEEAVVDGVVDGPAAHRRHDDVHAEVENQEEACHRLHALVRHGSLINS